MDLGVFVLLIMNLMRALFGMFSVLISFVLRLCFGGKYFLQWKMISGENDLFSVVWLEFCCTENS